MFLVKGPDSINCQSIISKSVEDANTWSLLSVPLEKHTSHLLAISIYLTACVWLIWKTQSTCLFLLGTSHYHAISRPAVPCECTIGRGAPGTGLGPRCPMVWLLFYQLCTWRWHPLQPPVNALVTAQLESQLTLPVLSQSGWVRSPKRCAWRRAAAGKERETHSLFVPGYRWHFVQQVKKSGP